MSSFNEVTDQNFDAEVIKSNQLTLVDFWAPWCGPCKMLLPVMEKLAEQYKGKIKIVKLNTDENQDVATKYSISAIPTVMFFKNGEIIKQIVGVRPLEELKKLVNETL